MPSSPSYGRLRILNRRVPGLGLAFAFLCLAAAGIPGASRAADPGPEPKLAWPPPPAKPRIEFVRTIDRPADFGLKSSFFARVGRWLSGADVTKMPFAKPFALSFDEDGNLCLTDTGQGAVWLFNRKEARFARWDKIGKIGFITPVAVAKTKGLIFVADTGLGCIVVFDEKGKLRRQISDRLSRPAGLALQNGQLLVTDSQRHCVVRFDLQGRYLSEFGSRGSGPGQFNFPTHIAADARGRLYVTDSLNARVLVFDAQGKSLGQVGQLGEGFGQLSRPKGLALDAQGNLLVLDAVFDSLLMFDAGGKPVLELGTTGARPGQFWLPNGIAVGSRNEVFVADTYNRRLQVFQLLPPP